MRKKEWLKKVLRALLLTFIVACLNTSLGTKVNAASIPHPMPIDKVFPDPSLANEMKITLGKKSVTDVVTQKELESKNEFNAAHKNIQSIEGLQYLTNLEVLYLSGNQITSISPLKSLKKLVVLNLDANELSDISDITKFSSSSALTHLFLNNNQLTDISALANLTNLETLDAMDNKLSSIQALASLEKLKMLRLSGNQVSDITGLEGLNNLEYVEIINQECINEPICYQPFLIIPNTIKTLEGKLIAPKKIRNNGKYAQENVQWVLSSYVDEVSYTFDELIRIGKTRAKFHGRVIQPLERKKLFIDNLKSIKEIFPDANLAEILRRALKKKHVTDLVSQHELDKIKEVHADDRDITSIEGLQYLFNLNKLYLADNQISDIRSLEVLTNLKELYLDNNGLTDKGVSGLINLAHLNTLSIRDNKVSGAMARNLMNNLTKLKDFNWCEQ
ncbi:leucine-rich repeat domain-containing protein [Listeria ivanovii]|uniref:leucine-rich repeat domain-containing protein n=1 Tax=Listeria ivanovii TaxID=1638 RepID=UPI00190BB133|nr:leucine-rich repeat domain-containing protein [Listeria ivanovii]MBK3914675.1 internalin [Listeria ivanovii subsp. ivanovii]MBK3921427.1 internalin [Listeria ivanovii subsp. ivanovii]MBK3926591.1 internalin [Listeria ivanovii subsp. ivanovii]